jgi:hypothetical protein
MDVDLLRGVDVLRSSGGVSLMRTYRFIFNLLLMLAWFIPDFALAAPPHGTGIVAVSQPVLPAYNDLSTTNWPNAGLASISGIPTRNTICQTVTPSGITPPASGDDASKITAAIAACTAGQVVSLNGAFHITMSETSILLNKAITIRGAGSPTGTCGIIGGGVTTNAATAAGNNVLSFASVPATVAVGMTVQDKTNISSGVITGLTVASFTSTTVTLSGNATGTGVASGDNIFFGTGVPCWPSGITVDNGAIPDWWVSTTQAGVTCGTSATNLVTCSGGPVFLVSPSGTFNWGWAGCFLGTTPTGCGATLTADAAAGATTVSVSSTANFSVGMYALIDENPAVVSTTNPTGGAAINASPEWSSNVGSPQVGRFEGGDEPSTYSFSPNRLTSEIHKITSIGSGTLTFDAPLSNGFRQSGSHDARVYWPTVQGPSANPFLQQAGIENLYIDRPPNGGISFEFAALSWVKNVEVRNWISGAVNIEYSARVEIDELFSHDCTDCENNGVEYPVALDSASTQVLVQDSIILRGGKGMVGRGSTTNVISYNYVDDHAYMQSVIGPSWEDMSLNSSHYAGTNHVLFEGNWADNCDGDETHGSAAYHVFFRNNCTATRSTWTEASTGRIVNDAADIAWGSGGGATPPATSPGPRRAAGPMALNVFYAYIGNVLGLAGLTTAGNGWSYQGAFSAHSGCTNKCLWMTGWVGSEWPAPDANLTAAVSPQWIFRSQNFDYVRNALDSTTGFTTTLPNSLYLSSAPAYFSAGATCSYSWPWVNSQGATKVAAASGPGPCTTYSGLPAKARYDAGTPFAQP